MDKTKTVSTVFYLDNHYANQALKTRIGNKQFPPELNTKYLGVTLNRTLRNEKPIEKVAQKLKTANSILDKLTGTSWCAHQTTLRTSVLVPVLCYVTAKCCAPVWERSKPDPAPRGGAYRDRAPPSENCAPKKLTSLGLLVRKLRSKLVFFED